MNAKWKVIYFTEQTGINPVSDFFDSLTPSQQVKILRIIECIEKYGPQSVIPHLKKISGTPFWEIRVLGKDNLRVIYLVPINKTVLLLHGFLKKKQKTPRKEITTAYRRYNSWKNNP